MNNKILIVPDVHGRDFWIEPCNDWNGDIIFLGDYHDPYTFQVSVKKSIKNLQLLVDFYEANKDRCKMIIGNHDGNYLIHTNFADRQDNYNYNLVKSQLQKLNLKVGYKIDDFIFSHAGILDEWLKIHNLSIDETLDLNINDRSLEDVSPYRGGYSKCGGPLWGDVNEFDTLQLFTDTKYYQIFGHSQQYQDPIITSYYACLDCRKCFILDLETKKIKEYENA